MSQPACVTFGFRRFPRPRLLIPDAVTCDSEDCPAGYKSIANPSATKCTDFQWNKSQCCEKVCSSKKCPPKYTAVADSDTKVCGEDGWSTDLCCVRGKSLFLLLLNARRPARTRQALFHYFDEAATVDRLAGTDVKSALTKSVVVWS